MSDALDVARVVRLLAARAIGIGQPLSHSAVTGSTNDDALAAAKDGAPHGATFVTDLQTHGRGRRGARWTAVAEQDLTFSVLLRPVLEPSAAAGLTLAVGLAVRDACASRVSAPVAVKWPNDVWINDEKLSGILVESTLHSGRPSAVVVGVGINVASRQFPEGLAHPATSLALAGASDLRREELLVDVLAEIARRTATFEREGLEPMLHDFSRHDALAGRRIDAEGQVGTAAGIDASGALLLTTDDGAVTRVTSGTVRLL